ncbi:MAG: MtrB/PioB family decaheme-associated outer membrane protein [Steroidobacteraceae bacterium]
MGNSSCFSKTLATLAVIGSIGPAVTLASSAVGLGLPEGNRLLPPGHNPFCVRDPLGLNQLRVESERSPSGFLYLAPCDREPASDTGDDWVMNLAVEVGGLFTSGDDDNSLYQEYADWDDGVLVNALQFEAWRPSSGSRVSLQAGGLGRDDGWAAAKIGFGADASLDLFYDEIPHVYASNARTPYQGRGTGNLTLPASLVPGGSTSAQVASVVAAQDPIELKIQRSRAGIGFDFNPDETWKIFGRYTHEDRDGTKAYGGAFFFNFLHVPGTGGVTELPQPVDYTSHDFNLGLQYAGRRLQGNLVVSGSFFRNDIDALVWENPFSIGSFAPLPTGAFSPPRGRIDLYPDNDMLHARLELAYPLPGGRSLNATLGRGRMEQDDDLLPYTISSGMGGTAVSAINYDLWNTVDALPRRSADAQIDTTLAQFSFRSPLARAVDLSLDYRYYDENNDTPIFDARNALTGDVGYIVTDGALGSVVPFEHLVFTPGIPQIPFHYRSIPFEHTRREAKGQVDWRITPSQRLTLQLAREQFERRYREVEETEEDRVKLTWANTGFEHASLRLLAEWADRTGDDYDSDPYLPFYTEGLPGAVPLTPEGDPPHTLSSLRKYDVADRERLNLEGRVNLLLGTRTDGFVSVQYRDDDYGESQHGLRSEKSTTANAEISFAPSHDTSLHLYYSFQGRETELGNINDTAPGLGTDPGPGSATYPFANEWSGFTDEKDQIIGAGVTHSIGPVAMRLNLTHSMSDSDIDYSYASPAAWANPAASATLVGSGFPTIDIERTIVELDLRWAFARNQAVRLNCQFERGRIDDYHYTGLTRTNVFENVMLLGAVPEDWDTFAVGVFYQWSPRW